MSLSAPPTPEQLADLYSHLHAHPELSFAEHETAALLAQHLRELGFEVTTGVGRTGVVAVLDRGPGACVLLRADMDGLPVLERTGLPDASTVRAPGPDGTEVPVMHACGHDVHMTALLGAAATLVGDASWSGRLLLVLQPAEEVGQGAQAMVDDGLFDRFGRPDVVLGQHVAPLPAGTIGVRSGPMFAASDALRVTLHGRGGHGSRPETTVDPVVLGASVVTRLQTIVSRELPGTTTAVLTVGSFHAGTAANVIGDHAELGLSVRTFDAATRTRVLESIERIARGESVAAGSPQEPTVETLHHFPSVVNDADALTRVRGAFADALPDVAVVDPGVVTGSEDVGILGEAAGAPCVYWLLGGADPTLFSDCASPDDAAAVVASLPSNHSPFYAPVTDPTLTVGVAALSAAALAWLAGD